jgi:DNA repair ATPase RecN
MKRIIHRELLKIFSNTETAEDDAKYTALSEFADELHDYCRREKDLAERTRTLRFARSELATAQGRIIHTGAGKKCGGAANYCTSRFAH